MMFSYSGRGCCSLRLFRLERERLGRIGWPLHSPSTASRELTGRLKAAIRSWFTDDGHSTVGAGSVHNDGLSLDSDWQRGRSGDDAKSSWKPCRWLL